MPIKMKTQPVDSVYVISSAISNMVTSVTLGGHMTVVVYGSHSITWELLG